MNVKKNSLYRGIIIEKSLLQGKEKREEGTARYPISQAYSLEKKLDRRKRILVIGGMARKLRRLLCLGRLEREKEQEGPSM